MAQLLNAQVIKGFVEACLLSNFDDPAPVPQCHIEWWEACCQPNKFVAIAAPRGFAKSTAITHSFTLAKILFRESSYAIIVSDTEAQAILFVNDLKKEIIDNDNIRQMFGVKGLAKDSETDFIVEFEDGHLARVKAYGSGKAMRGLKWGHKRPDLIICDDMENDEMVMNKERREKALRWFSSTLLPIRSDKGIIRIVGTILHADSLLESFMPKERDKDTVVTPIKIYSTRPRQWLAYKYRAHGPNFSPLLWPEKKTKEVLQGLRDYYQGIGLIDVYSQEYLNNPIDESNTHFRRSDLLAISDEDREKNLTYYITMDLAVTIKTASDYSVFIIWGVDSEGYVQVRHLVRGRFDSLEIAEILFELVRDYDPMMVVTEKGIIANSILPAIAKKMEEDDLYFRIELLPSTTDKLQRSQAIRLRARAGRVKIDKKAEWYSAFEEELLLFPRLGKDDQVDAFALIGQVLNKFHEAKTPKEEAEEADLEEYQHSGLVLDGRSEWTGY